MLPPATLPSDLQLPGALHPQPHHPPQRSIAMEMDFRIHSQFLSGFHCLQDSVGPQGPPHIPCPTPHIPRPCVTAHMVKADSWPLCWTLPRLLSVLEIPPPTLDDTLQTVTPAELPGASGQVSFQGSLGRHVSLNRMICLRGTPLRLGPWSGILVSSFPLCPQNTRPCLRHSCGSGWKGQQWSQLREARPSALESLRAL